MELGGAGYLVPLAGVVFLVFPAFYVVTTYDADPETVLWGGGAVLLLLTLLGAAGYRIRQYRSLGPGEDRVEYLRKQREE
jgi:hypothetical protein